jgi:adenylate cyclase, class 2
MAIEIEKKYRLDRKQRDRVAARLKESGAIFAGEAFEENFLHNFLHKGGDLKEKSAVLRLRKIGDTTILTYKEKVREDFDIKHRLEYETKVSDVIATEQIIQALGFSLNVIYEKRRQTWHFEDVEVVLDELPFGLFMEIEGTADAIEKTEKKLEVGDLEPESRGYPRLTIAQGNKIGEVYEARFER